MSNLSHLALYMTFVFISSSEHSIHQYFSRKFFKSVWIASFHTRNNEFKAFAISINNKIIIVHRPMNIFVSIQLKMFEYVTYNSTVHFTVPLVTHNFVKILALPSAYYITMVNSPIWTAASWLMIDVCNGIRVMLTGQMMNVIRYPEIISIQHTNGIPKGWSKWWNAHELVKFETTC